jgi:hypothetical protein
MVTVPTAPALDEIFEQQTEEHLVPQHKLKILKHACYLTNLKLQTETLKQFSVQHTYR